jgi:hypothetical protein
MIHAGATFALVEANWFVLAERNRRGFSYSYRSPGTIEVEGKPGIRIHDHVMLAQLGAIAVAALAMLSTILRKERR